MRALILVFAVLGVGCQYGPEDIPALYNLRDAHARNVRNVETIIFRIEKEHNLESRGSVLGPDAQVLARLYSELALLEDEWFKGLDQTKQLQWRMHRDQVGIGAEREVKVYQDLSPNGNKR